MCSVKVSCNWWSYNWLVVQTAAMVLEIIGCNNNYPLGMSSSFPWQDGRQVSGIGFITAECERLPKMFSMDTTNVAYYGRKADVSDKLATNCDIIGCETA